MIAKIYFIFTFILLQNILLISTVFSAEQYIEVDSIVAIAETRTITKLELDNKKEKIKKTYLMQKLDVPSDKKITKQALDQLITEKLVLEYASNQGIAVSPEQLNNVINNIAKSNELSIEKMIEDIESDGTNFSDFREDIRRQLIFDQVKRRIISTNIKISEFEIDNFIELQKERRQLNIIFLIFLLNLSKIMMKLIRKKQILN